MELHVCPTHILNPASFSCINTDAHDAARCADGYYPQMLPSAYATAEELATFHLTGPLRSITRLGVWRSFFRVRVSMSVPVTMRAVEFLAPACLFTTLPRRRPRSLWTRG